MNVLFLATDIYGGEGGIALFNRQMLGALSLSPHVGSIRAIARSASSGTPVLPDKVLQLNHKGAGKLSFLWKALSTALKHRHLDLIVCGHMNLLPAAVAAKKVSGARIVLVTYGIDAWAAPTQTLVRRCVDLIDAHLTISKHTRARFQSWAKLQVPEFVVPPGIDLSRYGPGQRNEALAVRLGIGSGPVLMTLARLAGGEQYKGFDEIIAIIPTLLDQYPDLQYVIAGDGSDRDRLESLVKGAGLECHVIFTGFVEEREKADLYRLADVFILAGRGEGFGFVLVEAMACGIPVVASSLDASRETVLSSQSGLVVNPDDPSQLFRAIESSLGRAKQQNPDLAFFSLHSFNRRIDDVMRRLAEK